MSMFSSEQKFKVNGDTKDGLSKVLELVDVMSGSKASSYKFDEKKFEIFWYYHPEKGEYPTPDKMTCAELQPFIQKFLEQADYDEADDMDGSIYKGWVVHHELWYGDYSEDYNSYKIITIRPDYIYYGK